MANLLSLRSIASLRRLAGSAAVLALVAARPALAGPTLSTVYSFPGPNGGAAPANGLTMDANGNMYGTTENGGPNGNGWHDGTVFELAGGQVTTLATLSSTTGIFPFGSVLLNAGTLFGTTTSGTVFSVPVTGGTASVIATLNSATTGADPKGTLIADAAGNMYGTASMGGANGAGTVFEVANNAQHTVSTLGTFNGAGNGSDPYGTMVQVNGNLYGTAYLGGANDQGTVFEITGGTMTTLATFNGAGNGANPYGGLIADQAGNMYGVASAGGAHGDGTIFEIPAGTSTIQTLASFTASGAYPEASLLLDGQGDLFGTTVGDGGSGDGSVFELLAGSNSITTIASFNGTNGQTPYSNLVADANGNLFGTTEYGGAGYGTIFEVANSGFVSAAPEPASLALLALGGLLIVSGRRARRV